MSKDSDEILAQEIKKEYGQDFELIVLDADSIENISLYLKHEKVMFKDIPFLCEIGKLTQYLEQEYGRIAFKDHFLNAS